MPNRLEPDQDRQAGISLHDTPASIAVDTPQLGSLLATGGAGEVAGMRHPWVVGAIGAVLVLVVSVVLYSRSSEK